MTNINQHFLLKTLSNFVQKSLAIKGLSRNFNLKFKIQNYLTLLCLTNFNCFQIVLFFRTTKQFLCVLNNGLFRLDIQSTILKQWIFYIISCPIIYKSIFIFQLICFRNSTLWFWIENSINFVSNKNIYLHSIIVIKSGQNIKMQTNMFLDV